MLTCSEVLCNSQWKCDVEGFANSVRQQVHREVLMWRSQRSVMLIAEKCDAITEKCDAEVMLLLAQI